MKISLWMPDAEPEIFPTEDSWFQDERTIEAYSPDGDWRYTVRLIDEDASFTDIDRLLTSPARAFFTAHYTRETPEGIDPHSLMRGEAGWLRVFNRENESFIDFLRVA